MDIILIITTFMTLILLLYICFAPGKNKIVWSAAALQCIAFLWSFVKLIELLAQTTQLQKISYIILLCLISFAGPAWLVFCYFFTNKKITNYFVFLIPLVFVFGVVFRSDFYFVLVEKRYVPHGLVFLLNMALTCTYGFVGLVLLTSYSKKCNEIKRKQIKIVQLAFFIPLILGIFTTVNMVFFKNLIPVHQISTSGFSLTCSLITFAILRYRLLNLRSIAALLIVNNLKEPVLIFDVDNNITCSNESFKRQFGYFSMADNFVKVVFSEMNYNHDLINAVYNDSHINYKGEFEYNGKVFNTNVNSIYDNNHLIGKLMSFNDVTMYKLVIESLRNVKTGNGIDITEVSKLIEDEYNTITNSFANLTFTPTEIEIIKLIARGKSNKEIATELYKSYGTVRNIISNLLKRTGAENRTELVSLYILNQTEERL